MKIFTNGCFDILHTGHIKILKTCRELTGDNGIVIVGLNSDKSVRSLKGIDRPIFPQKQRKEMLESIRYVDEVIIFNESTPYNLIKAVKPDILVKGSDYADKEITGKDLVEKVVFVNILKGDYNKKISSSKIIWRIRRENK